MSSKNDTENAAGAAMMAGFAIVCLFLFFLAGLLSLVLTLMCLTALKEEKTYFDSTITPREAKQFIAWGIVGAIIVGAFGAMLYDGGLLLERNRVWMPVIGYVIGSLTFGYLNNNVQETAKRAEEERYEANPSQVNSTPASPYLMPVEEVEAQRRPPFRYASWDDEEQR